MADRKNKKLLPTGKKPTLSKLMIPHKAQKVEIG